MGLNLTNVVVASSQQETFDESEWNALMRGILWILKLFKDKVTRATIA